MLDSPCRCTERPRLRAGGGHSRNYFNFAQSLDTGKNSTFPDEALARRRASSQKYILRTVDCCGHLCVHLKNIFRACWMRIGVKKITETRNKTEKQKYIFCRYEMLLTYMHTRWRLHPSCPCWRVCAQMGGRKKINIMKFYSIEDVCSLTSFSRGGIYKQVKNGLLPAPIKWGHASRWLVNEIQAVFSARLANKTDAEVRLLVKELHDARAQAQQRAQGGVA